MNTYARLPGALDNQSLNGISDWFGMPTWVKSYWETIKHKIADLQGLGLQISTYQQRIAVAQQTLLRKGDTVGADALGYELQKINDDLQKWWKVKGYIDKYLPEWMKLDSNEIVTTPGSAVHGLGYVQFVLAGMALTALAYCVTTGMALLQDYAFKSQLTQAVIDKKIETGQMRDILSIPGNETIFTKAGEAVKDVVASVGFGIPIALVVGGGLYVLFATGMLNSILRSVGLGGSSSSTT